MVLLVSELLVFICSIQVQRRPVPASPTWMIRIVKRGGREEGRGGGGGGRRRREEVPLCSASLRFCHLLPPPSTSSFSAISFCLPFSTTTTKERGVGGGECHLLLLVLARKVAREGAGENDGEFLTFPLEVNCCVCVCARACVAFIVGRVTSHSLTCLVPRH